MKKIVISPVDTKAIAFFLKIEKRKKEHRNKIEAKLNELVKLKNSR